MSTSLRVGVIGLGVGEQHLITYLRHPGCTVVAACDFSSEKRAQVQGRHPDVRLHADASAVLDDPTIDLVSIASFDDAHHEQVLAALRTKKHVFVEKPLCLSLDQLADIKLAWAAHEGRVALRSNLVLRAAPLYRWLRAHIQSGALGEVYAFDGDYLYGRLPKITDGWRTDLSDYSVMAGGGVHLVDLLVWLTGERPDRVFAVGNKICTEGTRFQPADYVSATMWCPSGMIARITANFGCVHGHQHVVRAFGTSGTMIYDDRGPRLQVQRDPAPAAESLDLAPLPPSKGALLSEFVDSILAGRSGTEETQCDFDVVSICLASAESLRTGMIQEIKYV